MKYLIEIETEDYFTDDKLNKTLIIKNISRFLSNWVMSSEIKGEGYKMTLKVI